MKLKIINPAVGISQEQIKAWQQYLSEFLLPDTILEFENIPSGFPALENKTQDIINGAEVLKIVARAQEESVQGIFINCFNDPAVLAAREFSDIPVLGPYEPSVLFASMLADRLAVISTDQYGLLSEGRKVYEYKTADRIYKIMNVNLSVLQLSNHKLLLNRLIECCRELEQEQVGAAVLGCTGMCSMIEPLKAELHENGIHIQVIEPLKAGVTSLEYMVRMGYSNRIYGAKIGAFPD
ncbi:MAG: aspartate/glutamate racemase family protein [Emergencia timonensis]|uniref:aspartate/glutamate racemase family protein n=1 Tax=Emergencia timonensis TaxID=1776384 RepID=UPI0008313CBB|nr:aspartate/glutamate racemase family protein [Emergencia timonensis]WNX90314.1 aspartate/glutamate racemase family protein [Emergencia timonensis]